MTPEEKVEIEELKEAVLWAKQRIVIHEEKIAEIRKIREEQERNARKLRWHSFI